MKSFLANKNLAALLFLFAMGMDLVGGRWGGYIRSPLPGVYLPDFLYLTALFLVVIESGNIREILHGRTFQISAIAIGYVAVKLVISQLVYKGNLSFAIRDGAALVFFGTAPLVGIALRKIKNERIFSLIRWSSLIYSIIFLLVYLGLVTPFYSVFLGNDHVRIFEFGGDLIGVICGIAYLFWSDKRVDHKFSCIARVLVIAPLLLNNSRGGDLAMAVIVLLTLIFINKYRWKSELVIILLGLTLGGIISTKPVESYYGVPAYSSNIDIGKAGPKDGVSSSALSKFMRSDDVFSSETRDRYRANKSYPEISNTEYFKPFTMPYKIQEIIEKDGTTYARLATWKILAEYLIRKNMFVFGAPYGSNVMFEACANPYLPTYGTAYPGGGISGPKCPVDSNETYSPVRDAHNFIFTVFTYNGLVGVGIFSILLISQFRRPNLEKSRYRDYPIIALIGYAVSGLFSTFALSSFVLLPCALFLALLSNEEPTVE